MQYKPVSRRDFIKALRKLGFTGPEAGGRQEIMRRGDQSLILPNPHRGDISVPLLKEVLRQAGISDEEWGNT